MLLMLNFGWIPVNTVNFQLLESPERKPSLGSSKGGRYFQIFPCKDQFLHWQLIWVHKTDIELTGKCLECRWFIPRTRAHQHHHQLLAIAYSCWYCTCSKLCGLFSDCEPSDDVNWCTQFFIAQLHHRWACFSCCTHEWRLLWMVKTKHHYCFCGFIMIFKWQTGQGLQALYCTTPEGA